MSLKVGQRISYNGEICTVRFIGEIPAWPGEQAIGVEWDNIAKGKHDGSYKGTQFFKVRHSGSGSFLKATKKHDGTKSFYGALIETYGTKVDELEIKIGKKYVESYGFEKLQKLQSDLGYLKNISLSRKLVNRIEDEEIRYIKEGLVNLRELDLSFNFFTDLSDVQKITSHLSLTALNLTGNRITEVSLKEESSIKSINLSLTFPPEDVLQNIVERFPLLEKLYLEDNLFESFTTDLSTVKDLRLLDLSLNSLSEIPTNITSTKITSLNVSDNNITILPKYKTFINILNLDIRRNKIQTWREIELLQDQFPNIVELRINGNPVFEGLTSEEAEYNVIAMFPDLKSLNGVNITEQERINAELYFISQVNNGHIKYNLEKLEVLAKKHGRVINTNQGNLPNKSDIVNLKFKHDDKLLEIQLLRSIEIIRLRGILSRLLKKSVLDFCITYDIGEFKETLENDLALLSSFNFEDGQTLTIQSQV